MSDDYGNKITGFDNWGQFCGSMLNPFGFFDGDYFPILEDME